MPTNRAPRTEGPATRFGLVRGFFLDRKARNYRSVFAAFEVGFTEDEASRIEDLWNARAQVNENDLPLIERMERVVENIKAAA